MEHGGSVEKGEKAGVALDKMIVNTEWGAFDNEVNLSRTFVEVQALKESSSPCSEKSCLSLFSTTE